MFPSTVIAFKTTHATACPRFCCFIGLKDLSGTALVETWSVWVNRQSIHFALLSCPSCFHGILTLPQGVFDMTSQGLVFPVLKVVKLDVYFLELSCPFLVFRFFQPWDLATGREREIQPSPYASCCQAALISVASLTMLHMSLRLPKLTIQTLPQHNWQKTMENWELADAQGPMCKSYQYHFCEIEGNLDIHTGISFVWSSISNSTTSKISKWFARNRNFRLPPWLVLLALIT